MGFSPNYSPASLPFSCVYHFLVCLLGGGGENPEERRNTAHGSSARLPRRHPCSARAGKGCYCHFRTCGPRYIPASLSSLSCCPDAAVKPHFHLTPRCSTWCPSGPSCWRCGSLSLLPRAPAPPAAPPPPPPRPSPPLSLATSGWSSPTSLPSPPPRSPPPRAQGSRRPSRSLPSAPWSHSRCRPPTPQPPPPAARPSTSRWGRRSPAHTTSRPARSPHTTAASGPASPTLPCWLARPAPRSMALRSPTGLTTAMPRRLPGPRSLPTAMHLHRAATRTPTMGGTGGGTAPKHPTCHRAPGRLSQRIPLVTPWARLLLGSTSHPARRRPTSPTRCWLRSRLRCSKR